MSYKNIDVEIFKRLIDELPVGCVVLDGSGMILLYNNKCETILGFSRAEVLGKRWDQAIYFEPKTRSMLMRSFRKKIVVSYNKINLVRRNLDIVPCTVKTVPIVDNGIISCIIAYFDDISERERMKENVLKIDKINFLERISIAIAHEIRNPLMVLSGTLGVLKVKQCSDCLNANILNNAIQEVINIGNIIDNFLYFAKAKKFTLKSSRIEDVVTEIYNNFLVILKDKNRISMHLDIEGSIPSVNIDRNSIMQILYNLIINGINAVMHTGEIHIKIKKLANIDLRGSYLVSKYFDSPVRFRQSFLEYISPENYILIAVTDSAGKLDTRNIDKIFDPFISLRKKGIGLGLSVIRALVDEHDGGILIKSVSGKLTSVGFFLPYSKQI